MEVYTFGGQGDSGLIAGDSFWRGAHFCLRVGKIAMRLGGFAIECDGVSETFYRVFEAIELALHGAEIDQRIGIVGRQFVGFSVRVLRRLPFARVVECIREVEMGAGIVRFDGRCRLKCLRSGFGTAQFGR